MINVTGQQSIPQNSIMIMAGIAKVFVGEVVEKGFFFFFYYFFFIFLTKKKFFFFSTRN